MADRHEAVDIALSIVIVNWNSLDFVRAAVRSIVAETRAVHYEIIVVDNASFDGCDEQLRPECPEVVFLQTGRNLGFGGANNFGAERARGAALLFLNPDTEVLDGAIDRMFAAFTPLVDAGIMGCRLLNTDGSLQTSCVQALPTIMNQILDADVLRRLMPRARMWRTEALFEHSPAPVAVEAVSGACMMVRRDVFLGAGGFSPAFFMYGEDLDLCARVGGAGLRNLYVDDCRILHHGGGSTRKAPSTRSVVMLCESVSVLLRRMRGPLTSTGYRAAMTLSACGRLVLLGLIWPASLLTGKAKGWRDTWRKWAAILGWGLGVSPHARPRLEEPVGARG